MNLKNIGSNQTEIEFANGYTLYSYNTPVVVTMKSTGEVYVTNKFWSVTTSRHIKKYIKQFGLDDVDRSKPVSPLSRLRVVEQDKINELAGGK